MKFTVDGEGCQRCVWKAEYAGEANLAGQIPVTGEAGNAELITEPAALVPGFVNHRSELRLSLRQ